MGRPPKDNGKKRHLIAFENNAIPSIRGLCPEQKTIPASHSSNRTTAPQNVEFEFCPQR